MSFEYNSSGLRTAKIVNGETTQYFYSGDLLIGEYDGLEYLTFTYNPSGEPVGFTMIDEECNEIIGYYIYLKIYKFINFQKNFKNHLIFALDGDIIP